MAGFTVGSVLIGIFSDRYLFRVFFYFLYITFKERGLNLDLKSFWYDFCCIFRFGRKLALMSSIVLYIGSNVSLSFVQDFWVFAALRFVSGVSVGGLLSTCYVMGKEVRISIIDSVWGKILKSWSCIIHAIFWHTSIKVCFSELDINKFVIFGAFRLRVGSICWQEWYTCCFGESERYS